ncbi:WecB/TagA/CpsF family glycosyltransferase [Carnobacterium funditum]|uniref:WecB/TagA/CpsF family glycosyltransferase n=1 Tax=Carnobacterium funditum TaxID=2752 RepID=UPI00054F7FEE|nr:WecB/TagA/CpsF family glycosyltransferase [Carnobacterium funditum]
MKTKKIEILNVPFDNLTHKNFVSQLIKKVENGEKTFVITANPEIVMYANCNDDYMKLLKRANFITADGIGIIKGSKILGNPITERVTGYDLMLGLFHEAHTLKKKVYLLGSRQEVIELAVKKIEKEFPDITVVGYHNGYFNLSDDQIIKNVLDSNADMVFVGIGFPRQEKWIEQYLEKADKGLVMGVGGSFDAFTGKVKRAPAVFIELNLEWFYRLIRQPFRFKRMLVLPKFLIAVRKEKKLAKK